MPRHAGAARALVTRALAALLAAAGAASCSAAPGPTDPQATAPRQFVALRDVDATIMEEIRYHTRHNFTGEPVPGYRTPTCLLTRPAAEALHRAQRALLRQERSLKVYDCYRPKRAVDAFVEWSNDADNQTMKREFYPRVDKDRLFSEGYLARRSGHSRGSTVDLTVVELPAGRTRPYRPGQELVPCHAPRKKRFPDNSMDMGTGFDCFDSLSRTLDPRIRGEQRTHRRLLRDTLEREGFVNFPGEWWHYTYRREPFPDTYFDFPVARESLARGGSDRAPSNPSSSRGPAGTRSAATTPSPPRTASPGPPNSRRASSTIPLSLEWWAPRQYTWPQTVHRAKTS